MVNSTSTLPAHNRITSGKGGNNNGAGASGGDGSILFQPHRTVGLVTTAQPFSMNKSGAATSHLDTFLTVPLQERFVIYKCDSLKPVLVSDCLKGTRRSVTRRKKDSDSDDDDEDYDDIKGRGEKMYHAISDSSLSVTITTHSYKGRWAPSHLSLYKRTRTVDVRKIVKGNAWGIVDVVNLGRSKFNIGADTDDTDDGGNGTSKMENCMVLAFICARNTIGEEIDGVDIVGNDSDEDEDDSSSSDDDSSSSDSADDASMGIDNENDSDSDNNGEVVIVVASRTKITIQKRIPLSSVPDFTPTVAMHPHTYVNKILIGGSGVSGSDMLLLNIRSGKVIHYFQCLRKRKKGNMITNDKITTLEQSPAVDTVAVGTESGMVHLVNIRMDKSLFSLTHGNGSRRGSGKNNGKYSITSLSFRTDASALERGIAPLAVGQMDGSISIWDLTPRSNDDSDDEASPTAKNARRTLLCQMKKAHPGGVCKLAYLPQEPLLLSSGSKSNSLVMHIFDNPNHSGRVLRQRVGHIAPPCLIRYQHSSNGGVLASMADGTDAASCQILSCGGKGDSSLRVFSTARSVLDREYSQGKGLEKRARELGLAGGKADLLLKEVVGIAHSEAKTRDWGDLVTIHKDHAMAYVWSTKRKAQSGPVLRQEEWNISAMKLQPPKTAHATSVAISSCGNFAVIGTKGGVIYKYNLQSGMPRGSFPRDATNASAKAAKNQKLAGNISKTTKVLEKTLRIHKLNIEEEKSQHVIEAEHRLKMKLQRARHIDATVVGLAVDTLNKTLVSVGSDSKLILWSFATHAPHKRSPVHLSAPAVKMVHACDSDLLAISLEDYSVNLFDFSSLTVVRRFSIESSSARHTAPISDMAFGPDGRRLFTSSFDGTLRVWDVPTNTCIDWMTFASPPTSLSLSTTGEFLATSHQGKLGISLWCDKSFFQTIHLDGSHPPSRPFQMDEPASVAEEEDKESLAARTAKDQASLQSSLAISNSNMDDDNSMSDETVIEPKKEGLITLSGLPAAHWKNLFHLELVKERNKPSEEVKKAPDAPFFLQWRGGVGSSAPVEEETRTTEEPNGQNDDKPDDDWDAAWSDEEDETSETEGFEEEVDVDRTEKRKSDNDAETGDFPTTKKTEKPKRQKITHFRSELASMLEKCSREMNFETITEHMASMGPSAIDVALSTLCNGMHDLKEGLGLLHLCSMWLLEACKSRQNYEVINAYMHRFLHIHATTIAGIDASTQEKDNQILLQPQEIQDENVENMKRRQEVLETIKELKAAHSNATDCLRNKMQETLCLLGHFSRMV